MAAFDPATLERWRALAIVDRDGTTVGTISEFYLDRETGYPTWALVNTGLFGTAHTFVPLVHATEISDGLQVPYEKRHIKDTPRLDLHDELTPGEEAALFAHYGVEYQPSAEGSESGPVEGAEEVPADPGSVEGPGPVAAEPIDAVEIPADPESVEEPGLVTTEPTGSVEGSAEPGLAEVPEEPGSMPVEPTEAVDREEPTASGATEMDAETFEASGSSFGPDPDEATSQAPPEPGTPEPGDTTLVAPDGFEAASELDEDPTGPSNDASAARPAEADPSLASPADPSDPAADPSAPGADPSDPGAVPSQALLPDPDLSRTAPVEPGLPGSTAASPGPVPTTVDKADAVEAPRPAEDAGWPPGFEDHAPADPPTGASDRWREAKFAAERNRMARAAAQPEERSPLERARRRLERLVGVGQEHDSDEISPAERDAAERARRARLGLEDDDPRSR
jgi:PRC-barrel domain